MFVKKHGPGYFFHMPFCQLYIQNLETPIYLCQSASNQEAQAAR
jgi:hypothetical protein